MAYNLDEMLKNGIINQDQYNKYSQISGAGNYAAPAMQVPSNDAPPVAPVDNSGLSNLGNYSNNPSPVGPPTAAHTAPVPAYLAPTNQPNLNQYNVETPTETAARARADAQQRVADAQAAHGNPLPADVALANKPIDLGQPQVPTATPEVKPVASTPAAPTGPVVNPYQGLLDNLNQYRASVFGTAGTPGNSRNLNDQEQSRLNQIDAMEQNGTIPKSQADLLRQAVQKSAVERTTVPGQKGYFDKLSDNLQAQSGLEQDLAKQEALLSKVYSQEATEADKSELALHNNNLAMLKKKTDDINAFIQQAPTYKEDNKRYWNNMGAGRQAGFGLMALLSGVTAGLANKESHAFDQLNKEIDRDIDAQRKTYEAASDKYKTQLLAKNQDFARAHQIAGKSEDTARILKLQRLDQYARDLDTLAKTSGSEKVKLAAEKAQLNLGKEKAKTQFELYQSQWQMLHPGKGSTGTPASAQIVNTISEAVGKQENYNQAAQDIMGLAANGDVNLNPNSFDKAGGWFKGIGGSDLEKQEAVYGKNGAAIVRRIAQVVGDNPVTGEHSDADREFALKTILGEGDPNKIAKRLQERAQKSAKEVQRQAAALSPKQQEYVTRNMLPAQTPKAEPNLSGQRQ